jgi:hypothetical protein
VSPNTINKPLIATRAHREKRSRNHAARHTRKTLASGDKAGMKYNYSEFIPPHGAKAPFMARRPGNKKRNGQNLRAPTQYGYAAHPKGYALRLLLRLIIIERAMLELRSWIKLNSFR